MSTVKRMRYYVDTKFQAYGANIDLISLAIVADDEREYYAVNEECNFEACEPWVKENVLPVVLTQRELWRPKERIRAEVDAFLNGAYGQPEVWGYYCDYDWVAICGLFGRLIDLPRHWPQYCLDLKQLCWTLGDPKLPPVDATLDGGAEHDARADARWIRRVLGELADRSHPIVRGDH